MTQSNPDADPNPRGTDKKPNALIREKSPYLLQHAYNPVEWNPWGEAAFARARELDRPVFLSIGYSTCHWCHVMERESFEDPDTARLMNRAFVNIKVDREERPDIDSVYMAACQMMTGRGGWPLTIVMTPEREPFFAATYIPRTGRGGMVGMMELIPKTEALWRGDRDRVTQSARALTLELGRDSARPGAGGSAVMDRGLAELGFRQLAAMFDERHGGFGSAPKFPSPHNISFLLRYWKRTGNPDAERMAARSLEAMRHGGLFDHVGFGFHRYSADARWVLPHFEKMLYDQAMLITAYIDGFQALGRAEFGRAAEETIEYVLRDMTGPDGEFYSAEDADSEGEEGRFYVWTDSELGALLDPGEAEAAAMLFNVKPEGNFRDESTGRIAGTNHLHMTAGPEAEAARLGMEVGELEAVWASARRKLFAARGKRPRPLRDDKVLADWNGLMIGALARAGRALGRAEYVRAAARAAGFVLGRMGDGRGGLWHRYRDGEAAASGFLDDYAAMVGGLIELYQAEPDPAHLARALALNRRSLELFWDPADGGFFQAAESGDELPVRRKEIYDGAIPSGNSLAFHNLLRLSRLTADAGLEARAEALFRAFLPTVNQAPAGYIHFIAAVDYALGPGREVVIVGGSEEDAAPGFRAVLDRGFYPFTTALYRPPGPDPGPVGELAPHVRGMNPAQGRAAAFVCENNACREPVYSAEELESLLRG